MAVVGFEFTKISAQRNKGGKVTKVNQKVNILTVTPENLTFTKVAQPCLKFTFSTETSYEAFGSIALEGSLLYMASEKDVAEAVAEWKKTKAITKPLMAVVYNKILDKSLLLTLTLSEAIALPPPIRLPRVSMKK